MPSQDKMTKRLWGKLLLKISLLLFGVGSCLYWLEQQHYFSETTVAQDRWDAFYHFTENQAVDILLLGNSHMGVGVKPKQLSQQIGATAFDLSAPGTHIGDVYFALQEALTRCQPKVVAIETYSIRGFNPYQLDRSALSHQFRSFIARKNIGLKLLSTPALFSLQHYPYAWSNTIRNHRYIFVNRQQLFNKIFTPSVEKPLLVLGEQKKEFQKLTATTLAKYDSLGAIVEGCAYQYNDFTKRYVQRIIELCKEQNSQVLFLTIPMYYKHVENYSAWKATLAELLEEHTWLDLQDAYDCELFTPEHFENVDHPNQHVTISGATIVTDKLADFLLQNFALQLPNRTQDTIWQKLFEK